MFQFGNAITSLCGFGGLTTVSPHVESITLYHVDAQDVAFFQSDRDDHLCHLHELDLDLSEALALDPICSVRSLRKLTLSAMNFFDITVIPESISNLEHLEYLKLYYLKLRSLPAAIGSLSNLKTLKLIVCRGFRRLPDEIGHLRTLERLVISHCEELEELPDTLGGLANLKGLELFMCLMLRRLPDSFCHLQSLEACMVRATRIDRLPEQIDQLTQLRTLNWAASILAADPGFEGMGGPLPESFLNLEQLTYFGCGAIAPSVRARLCAALPRLEVLTDDEYYARRKREEAEEAEEEAQYKRERGEREGEEEEDEEDDDEEEGDA